MPAVFLATATLPALGQSRVRTGDELLLEKFTDLIRGKTVGLITNGSGVMQDGRHIADVLARLPEVKLAALFGPEHGIRGEAGAGEVVSDTIDAKTGVQVFSLYGKTRKPTAKMLSGIDVLLYDIQDVGARFYTYISTLDLCLEAAAENHVKFVVLDKPDMLRADMVDGPVLEDSLKSFVGIQSIPSVYGMTPGEFATMLNNAHLLENGEKADLTVIKMQDYSRDEWFDRTGLHWINPSPNLPDMESVEVYPGTVLLEATNISEGRGTEHPFNMIGAPFLDSRKLKAVLDTFHLGGVTFEPIDFVPRPFPWAENPKYLGVECHGVRISVIDRNIFRPVEMGVTLIWAIRKLSPDSLKIRERGFDLLSGRTEIFRMLMNGDTPEQIIESWQPGLKAFEEFRRHFLLYK